MKVGFWFRSLLAFLAVNGSLSLRAESSTIKLPLDGTVAIEYRLKSDTSKIYQSIEKSGLGVQYRIVSGNGSASQPFVCNISVENKSMNPWEGVLKVGVKVPADNADFYMPAFLYGKNKGELPHPEKEKLWPRLRKGNVNIPYSPYWMVRADRVSHPVSAMFVNDFVFAVSTSPYFINGANAIAPWIPESTGTLEKFNGFYCSYEKDVEVGCTFGYENAPVLYVDGMIVEERKSLSANCTMIPANGSRNFQIEIFAYKASAQQDISQVLRYNYFKYHESPRRIVEARQAAADISEAIYNYGFMPSVKSYGVLVKMRSDGSLDKWEHATLSWTGGVQTAIPMLLAGLRLNKPEYRQQALSAIQFAVDSSIIEKSGLPGNAYFGHKWHVKGWWQYDVSGEAYSSYVIGQALYYILKGYEYEKKYAGVEHPDWLEYCRKVILKILPTRNQQGEYPYLWNETGAPAEYNSFSGCWCLASTAYFMLLTGDRSMMDACKQSEKDYYNYVQKWYCYGTPLDTYKAVDSEGILSYIKACRFLHALTQDKIYLDHMLAGLEYEFSFKFGYNVPIKVPPLSKLGWSSSGGSVTSTCNPHIHPMSNCVLDELKYYTKFNPDPYVISRFKDTYYWGIQCYNRDDNEFDFGKKGWMSERFCHSEGLLIEKYPDGSPASTWFAFLTWGAANVLEGICGELWDERIDNQ